MGAAYTRRSRRAARSFYCDDHAVVVASADVEDRNPVTWLPAVRDRDQHGVGIAMDLPIGLKLIIHARDLLVEWQLLRFDLRDFSDGRLPIAKETAHPPP